MRYITAPESAPVTPTTAVTSPASKSPFSTLTLPRPTAPPSSCARTSLAASKNGCATSARIYLTIGSCQPHLKATNVKRSDSGIDFGDLGSGIWDLGSLAVANVPGCPCTLKRSPGGIVYLFGFG